MDYSGQILAIESSCDESAVALFDSRRGVLINLIHTQIDLHALYGGVVPDLASTEHLKKLPFLIKAAMSDQNFDAQKISKIVATSGAGLANCLAMGIASASALAIGLQKELYGANHLAGHAYSPFISIHAENPDTFESRYFNEFLPHLGLLVTGGNSILFEINETGKLSLICETLDDAAGEALDKGAKMLGFAYPGAPTLEKTALAGDKKKYSFPNGSARNIAENPNFSFSGLKTSLRYFLEKNSHSASDIPDICASYQYAVVEQLRKRCEYFLKKKHYKSFGLSGGVANNQTLRNALQQSAARAGAIFLPAERKYCGDNAAMIAFSAFIAPETLLKSTNRSLELLPSKPLSVQR